MNAEDAYVLAHPKPDTNENGELFEWFKGLFAVMLEEVNDMPPRERAEAVRVIRTGLAARRMNRGEFA